MLRANRRVNLVQSVLKALDVLECLASAGQPLSAQEVAQRCSVPRPTVHHYLVTLLTRGYVQTSLDRAHYHIGPKVLSLSESFLERLDLLELAKANMCELSQASGETVHLAILDGAEMLYVGKVDAPQSVRMHSTIGIRNPLHSTAMGKSVLAFLPAERRAMLLDQISLLPRTSCTITDRATLIEHLEVVRAQGYALDQMENEDGIHCVGGPVFNHAGQVVAAISISGPAYRLPLSRLLELSPSVVEAAQAVSRKLGYVSDSPAG